MSDYQPIAVWECPTNEGTPCYAIGSEAYYKKGWTPKRIEHVVDRVHVFDEFGKLRVDLPYSAVTIEFGPLPEVRDE